MKQILDKLIKKYGNLAEVSKAFGISHQTLTNWYRSEGYTKKVIDFYEKAKKNLNGQEKRL
jgi:hypothetical protein